MEWIRAYAISAIPRTTSRKIVRDFALFHVARRSQVSGRKDDATMTDNWNDRMQEHFDRLQAALGAEFRSELTTQLATIRTELTVQHAALRTELTDQHGALRTEFTDQHAALRTEFTDQQAALRTDLADQQATLRTDLAAQLAVHSTQLEERLEKRLDARLSQRLSVQAEELREIVRTAADNYGGVLGGLRRDIAEFRDEWRKNAEVTHMALANHVERIVVLEQATGMPRE